MSSNVTPSKNEIWLIHVLTVAQSCVFIKGQCRFMAQSGFRIDVVSGPGKQLDKLCAEEYVTGHRVRMKRAISPLYDLFALLRLFLIFKRLRPDIVHGHTPKASLLSAIAARLAGVPVYVHHLHGMRHSTAHGLKGRVIYWSEFLTCVLSARVFCVSRSLMNLAVKEKVCLAEKMRVLANGSIGGIDAALNFNPARYVSGMAEIRRELTIPTSARVIGYIGRIARDKGIEDLLHAWLVIRARHSQAVLIIVGPFDSSDPVPPRVLSRLQCDPDVRFVGETDDVAGYLSVIEVLLFPTHREGFGLIAAEASAMEVPAVAYAVTGCVDAVVNGTTGILVPDGDVNALADAVSGYLQDERLRQEHGRKGRERILRDFDRNLVWQALRDQYLELVPAELHTAARRAQGALVGERSEP